MITLYVAVGLLPPVKDALSGMFAARRFATR
ncbi:hypothetical protein BH11MYX2_BH11MYX2_32280 [soil metagenome]